MSNISNTLTNKQVLEQLFRGLVANQLSSYNHGFEPDHMFSSGDQIQSLTDAFNQGGSIDDVLNKYAAGDTGRQGFLNAIASSEPGQIPADDFYRRISSSVEDISSKPYPVQVLGINNLLKSAQNPNLTTGNWIHDPNPDYEVRSPGDDLIPERADFSSTINGIQDAVLQGANNAYDAGTLVNPTLSKWFYNKKGLSGPLATQSPQTMQTIRK